MGGVTFFEHLFDCCAVISCLLRPYLPPLTLRVSVCVCGSPSFRFKGECDGGGGGGGGIIVRADRGIAFPGLILRVAIHIGYLAEDLASHTQGSDKNQERLR